METIHNYDIVAIESKDWFERLLHGRFRHLGLVVPVISPGTQRQIKCVMQLTRGGWAITQELHQFKQKGNVQAYWLKIDQSKEETEADFRRLLGNTRWDGKKFTFASGVAQLYGWGASNVTLEGLLKFAEKK